MTTDNILFQAFCLGFKKPNLSNREIIIEMFGKEYYWRTEPIYTPSVKEFNKAVKEVNEQKGGKLFGMTASPNSLHEFSYHPQFMVEDPKLQPTAVGFPDADMLYRAYVSGCKYRIKVLNSDSLSENKLGLLGSKLVKWAEPHLGVSAYDPNRSYQFYKFKEIKIRCDEAYSQSQRNSLSQERFICLPWYACGGAIEVDSREVLRIPGYSKAKIAGKIGNEVVEVVFQSGERKLVEIV
ncbi:MAG TPA: hypothetical protein V6D33_12395 [Cyanophyceae cyanobacterium]